MRATAAIRGFLRFRSIRLSPSDANIGIFYGRMAMAYLYLKRFEDAEECGRKAAEKTRIWIERSAHVAALAYLGREAEARDAAQLLIAYQPGLTLRQKSTLADGNHPVALTGRVWCYVDADAAAVEPGDLLTTSDVPGHAMKVTDHARAQGAIVGKAMTRLKQGRGLVLVLVSLQ